MNIKYLIALVMMACLTSSCFLEEDNKDDFTIEGMVRDDITNQPAAGIDLYVSAMTPGGIFGGSQRIVAIKKTDASGFYKIRAKTQKEAERLDFHFNGGYTTKEYAYKTASLYMKEINRS